LILWPIGLALVIVWQVFRDTAIDYRLVALGAIIPDIVDAPFGGARVMHSLLASAVLLAVVMLATRQRRKARRRWLAVPIGTFIHLLVDGMWTHTNTFWWPLFGGSLHDRLPAVDRLWSVVALQEVAGLVAVTWFWRRFHLGDLEIRQNFLTKGRLPRQQ